MPTMSTAGSKRKQATAAAGTTSQVEIRPLQGPQEFKQCERIQRQVWGVAGASSELLGVTAKNGGVVLGAIAAGKIVGFLYAFLARRRGRLVHWSHLMAVEARYRDLGLGLRMKLAHRRLALADGIKSICWTYDPLQSRNAALNIGRLGGQVEEYLPDCYGGFHSRLERGLPSDRFVVDWKIGSASIARRLRSRDGAGVVHAAAVINETRENARGFLENRTIRLGLRDSRLLVEIPPDTDRMRVQALALGRRWRLEARQIFLHYFSAGYRVSGFIAPDATSVGPCYYVLGRRPRHAVRQAGR